MPEKPCFDLAIPVLHDEYSEFDPVRKLRIEPLAADLVCSEPDWSEPARPQLFWNEWGKAGDFHAIAGCGSQRGQ